ncbi:hypothetical protein C8K38_12391 [Rhodococcus sp. OK611]|uniref:WXG100-like domain-containing protein n=1 Tax=unclassified Rhodococcus (in: high G+C Gram-positive bacteria) TaxID=192944 RepID=UPI000BCD28A3|nr:MULTISPECIES: hypothetical protein [unclassified Rhodococcus (in: high G+C Gram-positive bacteria)]PTR36698.1 hypothetical protein C8K38_12391 [Rhodococcus sp. OK611]SNX93792.1 hypothetical protein SAMN05447004_12391 [Rhodococcus sp. OK270]
MPIDTRIDGNPESIRAAATWLRTSLATETTSTVDQLYKARNLADAGWDGTAGEGFVTRSTDSASKADELAAVIGEQAQAFDDSAAQLQRSKDEMRAVLDAAAAAGLTVVGDVIEEPGPAPADPGPAPTGDSVLAMAAHAEAVARVERHAALVSAYEVAGRGADAARAAWTLIVQASANAWNDLTKKWFFVVADLVNGAGATLAAWNTSTMLKKAQLMTDDAAKYLDLARTAPAGTPTSVIYRDVDLSKTLAREADEVIEAAAKADSTAGKVGFRVGGALAVAGVAYDIAHGKPTEQAIVSGAAGFGAAVAAGAVAGTLIPVPVLGTAAGAVGGAAVGLFTSGMVDSVYENGVDDLGDALGDGVDAVGDTGAAIGGLAKDAWNAVF